MSRARTCSIALASPAQADFGGLPHPTILAACELLGIEEVYELNRVATRGLLPDITFVLEVDPDTSERRVGQSPDRIEREGREFRQRVADGYRIVAGKYAERVVLLDGTRPPDELHEEIRGRLREHF